MLNSTVMINSWGVVAAQRSTSFGCGKGGNVTSAGWQVTLCDPVWHVSSRSGVATLRTAIYLLLTYLLTYTDPPLNPSTFVSGVRCKLFSTTVRVICRFVHFKCRHRSHDAVE